MDIQRLTQDEHYVRAAAEFGAALARLVRGYERNADRQRDLLQDIHFALWRSFETYQGLSSLRTWVYRVAHNTAASHVLKDRRARTAHWVDLDAAADAPVPEADLAALTGVYALDAMPTFRLTVTVANGQLTVQATGQGAYPVFAESPTKFFYKVVDAQLTFIPAADGKPAAVILHQGGADQRATRVS